MVREPLFTRFGRFSILMLAIEWIGFGSLHFSHANLTADMIPNWLEIFPGARHNIVIVTGIAEVAAGMLILTAEARRAAAALSLGLLVLLAPAMYHILASDGATAQMGPFAGAFRALLLPNNFLLAMCSLYLWRNPNASLALPSQPPQRSAASPGWVERWTHSLTVPLLLLLANCAGFLAALMGPKHDTATAMFWSMGCIAVGALIGFLFAVPRINPAARIQGPLIPNANVEAVSDWLTKILIGVGLVNFKEIGLFVGTSAAQLAEGIGQHQSFATGLIVYFFAVGVIQGYILTRLFLAARFVEEMGEAG